MFSPSTTTNLPRGSIDKFRAAPLTGNLNEIPFVPRGGANEQCFRNAGYDSSFMVMGEFLKMKGEGVSTVNHCERFFIWLGSIGIKGSSKAMITQALAEKLNIMIPGFFNMEEYPESERLKLV